MKPRDRLPLLALLWLLTAAGAGLLAAWLLRTEGRERVRVEVVERPAAGTAAAATEATTSPPGTPAGDGEPGGPPGSAAAPGAPARGAESPPPLPFPTLLVSVFESDGSPAESGSLYAVSAGEEGGDEERVFHCDQWEKGSARLRLPSPGVYDIGFRSFLDGSSATLLRDVAVGPGDGNEATLRVPAGAPVHFRVEGAWPPPGTEEALLVIDLWTEDDPAQVHLPGRSQRGWCSGSALLEEAAGASSPLETGRAYTLKARVQERRPLYEGNTPEARLQRPRLDTARFQAVPDRTTVRAGETVTVRIQPQGALVLLPYLAAPLAEKGAWDATTLSIGIRRDGTDQGLHAATVTRKPNAGPGGLLAGFVRPLEPGPVRVTWSGPGLVGGSTEELVVRPGEFLEVEIPVREDPAWDPSAAVPEVAAEPALPEPVAEPLEVSFGGVLPGEECILFATQEEGGIVLRDMGISIEGEGTDRLDADWRDSIAIAALRPPFLASALAPVPASGPLRLDLRPAGLVLVAPEEVFPPEFGTLRLRRADGGPIPLAGDGGLTYSGTAFETAVQAGTILGPFPPGTVVFEVRLGGLRLADARVGVKAGRIEVVRIGR